VDDLRALLTGMTPYARETLRHVLVMDQPDRDVVAAELLRYRDSAGDEMADVILGDPANRPEAWEVERAKARVERPELD
jgi:hypothetical protein